MASDAASLGDAHDIALNAAALVTFPHFMIPIDITILILLQCRLLLQPTCC
jgi:hypothetical protein